MRLKAALLLTVLSLAAPLAARAEDAPKTVRLIGESASPAPTKFVLDLTIKRDDSEFRSEVNGWAAVLPPEEGYGEVSGQCIETHCALTLNLSSHQVEVAADISAGAAATGRYAMTLDGADKPTRGQIRFTPFTTPPAGFGDLAAPGAVKAIELADLLVWNGSSAGFAYSDADELPDSFERGSLADWQAASGRPPNGMILTGELKALRDGRAAAQSSSGWKPLSGAGWTAGYPATLLPAATTAGREQRFASADGKALLIISIDPPMSDEAFDAYVDKETADNEARSSNNYTRVNSDLDMHYVEKGKIVVMSAHNREHGFARLTFTYPEDQEEKYGLFTGVLPKIFVVTDELKPR